MKQTSGIDGDSGSPLVLEFSRKTETIAGEKERLTHYEELAFTVMEASKF